jgi:hypothetical protein
VWRWEENGDGGGGVLMTAWTVASNFPLSPYVGDQMSSSTSSNWAIESVGDWKEVARVVVNVASGFTSRVQRCQRRGGGRQTFGI